MRFMYASEDSILKQCVSMYMKASDNMSKMRHLDPTTSRFSILQSPGAIFAANGLETSGPKLKVLVFRTISGSIRLSNSTY